MAAKRSALRCRKIRNQLCSSTSRNSSDHWHDSHRSILARDSLMTTPRNCAASRYQTKSPRLAPGAQAQTAGFSLPADLEAGSATRAAARAAAQDVTARDQLDPKRTVAFV